MVLCRYPKFFGVRVFLASVDPAKAKGREVTVREVLDAASENIEGKFKGAPLVEASIRSTLGVMYRRLGEYKAAEPHLECARQIRREQLGEEHPDTLNSMNNLANLYADQGRYEEAELCRVGIATADNPLGPWTKYAGNPVAYFEPTVNKGGGYYLGGVVKVDGTYYMYMSQYNELAYDYGYMYMATASSIYGPWTMHPSNDNPEPILKPSSSWDALGFSEADIFYYNGAFHMFYGGTSDEGDRPESIGYAWSNDGFNWHHFGNEPALPTSGLQNASAFAEVQSRIEYPGKHHRWCSRGTAQG